jgi:hypothetical protein
MVGEGFVGLTESKLIYEEMSQRARLESSGNASNGLYARSVIP